MVNLTFNAKLLEEVCKRDKCTVNFKLYNDLTRNTRITFLCGGENCNLEADKVFRELHLSGGFCPLCQKKVMQQRFRDTCLERHGVLYPMQSRVIQDKAKETFMETLGVENPFQSDEIKKKIIQNNMLNHGVPYVQMLEEVKNKVKETNLIRHGHENVMHNADIKEKLRQTTNERFGHDNVFQNEEIKEKIQNVMIEKFGYAHALQNSELAKKASEASYKSKPFTFPCGNIIQVQGYEPFALEFLVNEGQNYTDITTDRARVPDIWYETDDGKSHRYFCDIFLHKEDKIIEVKSDWTLEKGKDVIPLKAQACIDAGFEYEIWIFDEKKNLKVQTYDKPTVMFTEMLLSM